METFKSYLVLPRMPKIPKLRFPTLAQLRDGSFLNPRVEQLETEESWLRDFESKLVSAQEVAVWSSPYRSLVWLVVTQAMLYYLCTSPTPLLSTTMYFTLSAYIYITWVYTIWPAIRVPPTIDEDTENWTTVHPDVLSAPELDTFVKDSITKIYQIVTGLKLFREEQPGKLCVVLSLFFLSLAGLGMKFSTPFLLHSSAFLSLVLPAVIIRLNKNQNFAPILKFLSDFNSGLVDLLVYRGINAPPRENKELDEFVPEVNDENVSLLNKALSYVQKQDKEEDLSLIGNMSIPSHEEVENDSMNALLDFEKDLLPTSSLAIEQCVDQESSDSEVESPTGIIRDYNDSDTDSLDLEPEMKVPVVSMVTSSVTSVTNTVSSVTSLLGSFLKKNESEPDLDDFEMISDDELSAESP
eukprot:GFUD01032757.1.p1 GENE.GFUD01032757.1~~GFUD01032757.1.p1  ORF type:complete len:411 (-),score=136.91 GFUD01032757.1:267-1499(-)